MSVSSPISTTIVKSIVLYVISFPLISSIVALLLIIIIYTMCDYTYGSRSSYGLIIIIIIYKKHNKKHIIIYYYYCYNIIFKKRNILLYYCCDSPVLDDGATSMPGVPGRLSAHT